MALIRKYFYVILFFCLLLFLYFVVNLENVSHYYVTLYDYYYSVDGSLVTPVACRVPKLDPWDQSIAHLIKHPKSLHCPRVQPFMTYVDYNGYLRINQSEKFTDIRCFYRTFNRSAGLDDNSISYGKFVSIKNSAKLMSDTVEVKCFSNNDSQIYYNLHAHPMKTEKTFEQPTDNQLNVLFFMVDSTSYSALQRNLPLTYSYTRETMGFTYFKAFNKIGDNSFPNMMAMLTGKRATDEQDDMLSEIPSDNSTYYDQWPLIWKLFAQKGYSTMFNEDMADYGLFNYGAQGFRQKPTDHYYHTFWNKINKEEKFEHLYYCFYNTPKAVIHLDITKRHLMTMKNRLKFVFSVLSEHAHDYENDIERIDVLLTEFWKLLFEGNYLNKTVVIFASDHGIRFGKIRSSMTGLLEERLPFYAIWFPKWFYRLHPHILKNLHNNVDLLSSTFDVYETLLDIANSNYDGQQQRCPTCRGQSQLYALRSNRTCASAGIPDHYCTCMKETTLSVNDKTVLEAAQFLVTYLNSLLKNYAQLCHVIKFSKVLYVKRVDFDQKLKANIKTYNNVKLFQKDLAKNRTRSRLIPGVTLETLELAIETQPFEVGFEALVRSSINLHSAKTWTVTGAVSRITKYANLSDCVHDKILKKYCSCKRSSNVIY